MRPHEFNVVIDCPLETVFAIYIDTNRWRNRSVFGDIRWVQGIPWKEGSRLQVETRVPIHSTVDQVLQHFEPNRHVAFISHVFGMTCETRVAFTPLDGHQTAIHIRMQIVGAVSHFLGFAVEPAIEKTTREFFAALKTECNAAAPRATET